MARCRTHTYTYKHTYINSYIRCIHTHISYSYMNTYIHTYIRIMTHFPPPRLKQIDFGMIYTKFMNYDNTTVSQTMFSCFENWNKPQTHHPELFSFLFVLHSFFFFLLVFDDETKQNKTNKQTKTQGVSPGMTVGVNTEVIAGEGLIVTAGGMDPHVHFICPQICDEVSLRHYRY